MVSDKRWDIFCQVIDNYGDIGICWRLAADLAGRGREVRLWVDDPAALPEPMRQLIDEELAARTFVPRIQALVAVS